MPIDPVIDDGFFDHLPNRKKFALISSVVLGPKPIKTAVGIVGQLLLWQQERKPITVREGRPPGPNIVSRRSLSASVQNDDKCGIVRNRRRSIAEHTQIAGVRSESENLPQAGAAVGRNTGMMQHSKELLPPSPTAAEA